MVEMFNGNILSHTEMYATVFYCFWTGRRICIYRTLFHDIVLCYLSCLVETVNYDQ